MKRNYTIAFVAALGLSDVEAEEAMDLALKCRVGSITKTVTATLSGLFGYTAEKGQATEKAS